MSKSEAELNNETWDLFQRIFIALFLGVFLISIGATHIDACPVDFRIPIFAVTTGVCCLVTIPINIMVFFTDNLCCQCVSTILELFFIAFHICGMVWTFGIFTPEFSNEQDPNFCNWIMYSSMFWYLTIPISIGCYRALGLFLTSVGILTKVVL